jgi:hypothetical protein
MDDVTRLEQPGYQEDVDDKLEPGLKQQRS